ncbi:sensor histidine kinase [Sedimentibacter sp. zth1]|uniref:sensor histidine kinase n=1 Tax=Sedimentibacter sp. zth1 TaxID=2816908 RepID=UPI001F5FB2D5|nr:histidine kinase [Sedimentibacter sp. zth1]
MTNLFNRLLVMFILVILVLNNKATDAAILYINIAIAISLIEEYYNNNKFSNIVTIAYISLCIKFPNFIYFLPLMLYDVLFTKFYYLAFFGIVPIIIHYELFTFNTLIIIFITVPITILMKYKSNQYVRNKTLYLTQRDTLVELNISLKSKLNELKDRQDEEVNLATLNERNRIAREIHDNVGHLLTSSILQIGAIMLTTKDESTKNNLEIVKNTLDTGMTSIRNSVHGLRDTSINLYMQLKEIVDSFNYCSINFNYEIRSIICIKAKYAIISIVKEALNNVIKHSNATQVTINLYEHPKILQVIIFDNGSINTNITYTTGMGIEGIKQRVLSLNGIINISTTNGFKIFISFNKEDLNENSNCR